MHNKQVIGIIGKIFESFFLTKLFEGTNVVCIFYKWSKTCGTHTNDDTYLGMEGVADKSSFFMSMRK
jgi:hypothetical protein